MHPLKRTDMFKTLSLPLLSTLLVSLAAGCANAPPAPAGLIADRFVAMSCADNKGFQVRYAQDGRTVRVRSHHGAAELERQADGRFTGDGYTLDLQAAGGASLDHSGKSQGKACKVGA
jgi:hypothetical protein